MSKDLKEIQRIIWNTPSSDAKINLIEEAIRLADQLGEEKAGFNLRQDLVEECTEYGRFMKAVVAFSWCVSKVREEGFDFDSIIWHYQAVLSRVAWFDSITLEQIASMHQDYYTQMRAEGATDHSHHTRMLRTALVLWDKKMATQAMKGLASSPRDWHSDCTACVQSLYVQYELMFGTYEKALEYAKPILNGTMSCNMIPLRTYGFMINPVHRAGDHELAAKISATGLKLLGNKSGFLEQTGLHLIYLAETSPKKGITLFRKALRWALAETEAPLGLLYFNLGAWVLFSRLAPGRRNPLKALFDPRYPLYHPEGVYEFHPLIDYHYNKALELTERFDRRGRTDAYRNLLAAEKERLQKDGIDYL